MDKKEFGRIKRHNRIRKKIFGTELCPRLSVHGSHKNFFIQLIDDIKGHTLLSVSTLDKDFLQNKISGGNIKAAEKLGEITAKKAKEKSIGKVIFDRGGWLYTGRIKAFADSCRKNGLEF